MFVACISGLSFDIEVENNQHQPYTKYKTRIVF